MKKLKWNVGIMIIRIGYIIRLYQTRPINCSFRWWIGRHILLIGYKIRGQIPQKTWKWNHV